MLGAQILGGDLATSQLAGSQIDAQAQLFKTPGEIGGVPGEAVQQTNMMQAQK